MVRYRHTRGCQPVTLRELTAQLQRAGVTNQLLCDAVDHPVRVDADFPTDTAKFMLSAEQPVEIEPERLAKIEDFLSRQLQQDG